MLQTASTKVPLGPGLRPRQRAVLELVDEAFARLTDAPRVGPVRFVGYETGRQALYEVDFEVA